MTAIRLSVFLENIGRGIGAALFGFGSIVCFGLAIWPADLAIKPGYKNEWFVRALLLGMSAIKFYTGVFVWCCDFKRFWSFLKMSAHRERR